jgi:hypothetical protein
MTKISQFALAYASAFSFAIASFMVLSTAHAAPGNVVPGPQVTIISGLQLTDINGVIITLGPVDPTNPNGLFGYVNNTAQPPVIGPNNSGILFTPPPSFNVPKPITFPLPIEFLPKPTQVLSSVPEPENYAMMLAGLGLLGFAAHRRKSA